ncbi:hypothetical protein A1O3_04340 [Capronia epimyces CBS 606.96]|uniref:Ecp2 effector protein domain-containing protein n=1 Tax=Capronia epimyces CBS 606.96 TaxID=1182542 RepID=W9YDR9_9EURO|nr:uncharacterized protein A1O3_04340 [Capronia epimyces CBS 606.96]EXJ87381.1 hypothetical protein A1O3_04340 [Capronia epimyces CBS 606.96]
MTLLMTFAHLIIVLTALIRPSSAHPQVNRDITSGSVTSTYLPTKTFTGAPICNTGGGDWRIDPPTAMRLAQVFCDELVKPQNYPVEGASFFSAHYPSELSPQPGSPNYTEIELSGLFARGGLYRSKPWVAEGVLHVEGTDEQCERDNCTSALQSAIGMCEWNSHYVGGDNDFLSDCGVYSILIANCSGNWFDPDCDKWHEMHPNVGLSKNESLASLGLLPSTNTTTSVSITQKPLTSGSGTTQKPLPSGTATATETITLPLSLS